MSDLKTTDARFPFWWIVLSLYAVWIVGSVLQLSSGFLIGQTPAEIITDMIMRPPILTAFVWAGWNMHP